MNRIKRGDRLRHEAGFFGVASADSDSDSVTVRQDDGAISTWAGAFTNVQPLVDLLQLMLKDIEIGRYKPKIDPTKYGLSSAVEYQKRIAELAKLAI